MVGISRGMLSISNICSMDFLIFEMLNHWERFKSGVNSGDAGGARAPPEFGGSEKGQRLISA